MEHAATQVANVPSLPTAQVEPGRSIIQNLLSRSPGQDEPVPLAQGMAIAMGGEGGDALTRIGNSGSHTGPNVVRAAPSAPVQVSSGVSTGMLLSPIQPIYPALAKTAGVQGTVVVEAIISNAGRIKSARAVSGPAMLRGAAVEAVAAARYRPYRLNSQPVEVQTTVTVNFRLSN